MLYGIVVCVHIGYLLVFVQRVSLVWVYSSVLVVRSEGVLCGYVVLVSCLYSILL